MEQAYMGMGTQVDKGENARLSSMIGAMAISDLVKTTLGPKGMDKILQSLGDNNGGGSGDITVTNDGATILSSLHLDNAAAKVLVNMAQVQDAQIGDGTTSVAVLAGELLRQAEILLEQHRLHPQTICAGFRMARQVAVDELDKIATDEISRQDLINIAATTLSSKLVSSVKTQFAELCVDAVLGLGKETNDYNLDHVQILQLPGGSLRDSYLESNGFLLAKSIGVGQPKRMENCRIVLANTSMDTDKIKIYGSRVQVDSLTKVSEIEQAEKNKMKQKVDKILSYPKMNVFVNRQLIYNYPESLFAAAGVLAIEHADFDGMERLAAVTNGQVLSTFDMPDDESVLGHCDVIEEIMIGETKVIRFGGCASKAACTIVLRGSSTQLLQEAERSVHDALCILVATLKSPRRIYGGGHAECCMAHAVRQASLRVKSKQALAMNAVAEALIQLPRIVADNGGYDAPALVAQLTAAIVQGEFEGAAGLDMTKGEIGNMQQLGVLEAYQSKYQVVTSALEAAEMILRVDDIIKCAPRQRSEQF